MTRLTGTLHEDQYTSCVISRSAFRRMRNISEKCCRENQDTYFVFKNFFFRKSCHLWHIVEIYQAGRII